MNLQQTPITVSQGELDPAFGENGKVFLKTPDPLDQSFDMRGLLVDEEGNTYITGDILRSTRRTDYCCVKLDARGNLDKAFGTAGYVAGRFDSDNGGMTHSHAHEIVKLGDGKLLLIGSFFDGSLKKSKALVRLNADGSLDLGFGEQGKVIIDLGDESKLLRKSRGPSRFAAQSQGENSRSTVLADGRIVLHETVGWSFAKTTSAVIRLSATGDLDDSFGKHGIVQISHPDFSHTELNDLLAKKDGTYVLAGHAYNDDFNSVSALLTRLTDAGEIDTSFADDGYRLVTPEQNDLDFLIGKLVAQTNRRLLAVGWTYGGGVAGLLISREADGSKNIQFNGGEPLQTRLDGYQTTWHCASIKHDGKILVFGLVQTSDTPSYVVARFIDDGTLDTSYANGKGWRTFPIGEAFLDAASFTEDKVTFLGQVIVAGRPAYCVARGLIG
ncbi:delta-60 repeat domain-containing protein [Pseudomonas sp. AKS31]|uniref:delta-60 repeat domain-containing protein n=1 Tax=Pseudomonas sp. AKS31 TaxID=2949091 RepID=UPI00202AB98B|nr:delta-60 repeat domain-containing protein [Pseudomonas sp. AKS31]MCL9803672.1 delta-60 repeat domain-containing protein [Pseudomonas sp. AKS31]